MAWIAVAMVLAFMLSDGAPLRLLRAQVFDAYQRVLPRPRLSAPALVVAIDERTLAEHGQWPWPRTRFAELIGKVAAAQPAAIGIDILFAEPDRLSPRRIVEGASDIDPELARRISALRDNDAVLASALQDRRVVLGVVGDDAAAGASAERPLRAAPVLLKGPVEGLEAVPQYAGAVRSRPEMEWAAAGQGLINAIAEDVVRRVALLGRVGDRLLPNLEVEMLRVASGEAVIAVGLDSDGVREVRIGDLDIPTARDGSMWLRYGDRLGNRTVSAADVLAGTFDAEMLERKLVLIGVTGQGLVDQPPTPLGDRMPGVEIRAQLLENIFDRSWLVRPAGMAGFEALLFVLTAALFIWRVPRGTPLQAALLLSAVLVIEVLAGLVAFNRGVLVDTVFVAVAATLVFTIVLGTVLTDSQRQRRELARRLADERESAARLAGELETARRVQMGMLPDSPGVLAGDARVDLKAFMEPARSVGGDLYDFFMLDSRTLFVMIGDVSGKGMGAAMFMALIKSLCRSAVLRHPKALDQALAQAEDEIRRENPESLFVTLMVLCLDLDSGELTYCNAGHDPLYGLRPGQAVARRIDHGGRPPLCVLDDYPYPLGRDRLAPGEQLVLITDGITEANNGRGQLYGHARLEAVFAARGDADPSTVVESVRRDVAAFVDGAEQADDLAVLVLRWNGDAGAG
ncbi:MAG TPA: CHASE2 domain-containing protein [Verrucomicrobiae bacterium]|nr:CHASE2 domain-containing protein [Verrucomicrobiae bacterium]